MTIEIISKNPFITNPTINDLFKLMDTLRYNNKIFKKASCLLITGESGSGKSELARHYLEKYPIVKEEERIHIPVLWVELRSITSIKDLMRALLRAIHDPQNGMGGPTTEDLFERFIRLAKTVGLEILIIDELQVVIQRRGQAVIAGVADKFKELIEALNIPIVFMGMPWSKYLLRANEQLEERVKYKYKISPYKVSDAAGFDDYKKLLKLLAGFYQFGSEYLIHKADFALRIFGYTNGNLRRTVELIRDVYIFKVTNVTKNAMESFSCVLKSYGISDEENVFCRPLDQIILYEHVQYSDWSFGQRTDKKSIVESEYKSYGITAGKSIYLIKRAG